MRNPFDTPYVCLYTGNNIIITTTVINQQFITHENKVCNMCEKCTQHKYDCLYSSNRNSNKCIEPTLFEINNN